MDCSTRFPDPVEQIRAEVERLGLRLVLRLDRRSESGSCGAGSWLAEVRSAAAAPLQRRGASAEEAARAALEAARATAPDQSATGTR